MPKNSLNKLVNRFSSKRGLFIFSEAASANSILAVVSELRKSEEIEVYTDPNGKYDPDLYPYVKVLKDFGIPALTEIFDKFSPDYLFTGTSFDNIEHHWRKVAQQRNVFSISFIDHWVNYRKRFEVGNIVYYPDEILVINEVAKRQACAEGLPEDRIRISSNPYYDWLEENIENVIDKDFQQSLPFRLGTPYWVFVSENIRDDFPKLPSGTTTLGFDEYSTLHTILVHLEDLLSPYSMPRKLQIVVKIHPIEDPSKFEQMLNTLDLKHIDVYCIQKIHALTLINFSSFVIGMFSNLLIESLYLRKDTLRVQIDSLKDLFHFDLIPVKNVTTNEELREVLKQKLNKK